ncbi:MAG TPA: hypothetical protein VFD74_09145 [Thermoleophilia bacterium]|nr:hypothetical protein [Thermoleophilia bacterium]
MGQGLPERYRVDEIAVRHQERALAVTAGRIGGAEIRPTRVFLWVGTRTAGRERMISMDSQPHLLRSGRRRHLDLGACHVSFLGNPLLTLGLFAVKAVRRAAGGRSGATPAA